VNKLFLLNKTEDKNEAKQKSRMDAMDEFVSFLDTNALLCDSTGGSSSVSGIAQMRATYKSGKRDDLLRDISFQFVFYAL
jgi:hypothetical protein